MKINKDTVINTAKLARLELKEESINDLSEKIANIIQYIDILGEVNTEGVKPSSHAAAIVNAFREDEPGVSIENQDALANAPLKEDGYFVVPKII